MQYVMIYGNPVDGFRIVGPFKTHNDAARYSQGESDNRDWWIAELDAPAGDCVDE